MHISKKGLDLIKKYEGLYLKAYKCPAGILTIGYGTTNSDKKITNFVINSKSKITKEQAESFLKKSIEVKYEPLVNKYNNIYNFNQNEFDALVSFCYNLGSIDQLTQHGKRSKKDIAIYMIKYNHAGGKVLNGLTKRRNEERDLFIKKIDKTNSEKLKADWYCVTSVGLNVRAGAGTKYKVINVLSKNNKIYIDKISGNWGRVKKYNGKNINGWICMNYVKKI